MSPSALTDLIGYAGAIVGTYLMVPQVLKARSTGKMDDVSWGTVILYVFNCVLWFTWAYRLHAVPGAIANAIGFIISIAQVYFKKKCSTRDAHSPG